MSDEEVDNICCNEPHKWLPSDLFVQACLPCSDVWHACLHVLKHRDLTWSTCEAACTELLRIVTEEPQKRYSLMLSILATQSLLIIHSQSSKPA